MSKPLSLGGLRLLGHRPTSLQKADDGSILDAAAERYQPGQPVTEEGPEHRTRKGSGKSGQAGTLITPDSGIESRCVPEKVLSRRLAEAETPRDFRDIADLAEFAQELAKRQGWAYQRLFEYGRYRIVALRALSPAVDRVPRLGRGNPANIPGGNVLPSLQQILGTDTAQKARKLKWFADKLAAIAEPIYHDYLAMAWRKELPPDPNGLLAFAQPIHRSQCYTRPADARRLYELVCGLLAGIGLKIDVWMDPSAGNGAFYDLFPEDARVGIDIDPKRPEFLGMNFLDFDGFEPGKRYAVLGNFPWPNRGALTHFNHAAKFPSVLVIASLLPESFQRPNLARSIDKGFRLLHREDLRRIQFEYRRKGVISASLFEIWVRTDAELAIPLGPGEAALSFAVPVRRHSDFEFLPRDSDYRTADIIMRRVGTDAGRLLEPGEVPTLANCHLIRISPGTDSAKVRSRLMSISWEHPQYLDCGTGHAERGYKAISMEAVVAEYEKVAELDVWRSLTRSLIERGYGDELRRYLDELR